MTWKKNKNKVLINALSFLHNLFSPFFPFFKIYFSLFSSFHFCIFWIFLSLIFFCIFFILVFLFSVFFCMFCIFFACIASFTSVQSCAYFVCSAVLNFFNSKFFSFVLYLLICIYAALAFQVYVSFFPNFCHTHAQLAISTWVEILLVLILKVGL